MDDPVEKFLPGLSVGERISVRAIEDGRPNDVIGFVVALGDAAVEVEDTSGQIRSLARDDVRAAKRVPVSRGRNPLTTPPDLLDALAARAGAFGLPHLARISDLLAGRTPPASAPPRGRRALIEGHEARFEGEWVTLADADPDAARAAAWWATRMGARSVQVRTDDPELARLLKDAGFREPHPRPTS